MFQPFIAYYFFRPAHLGNHSRDFLLGGTTCCFFLFVIVLNKSKHTIAIVSINGWKKVLALVLIMFFIFGSFLFLNKR